jgi:hypothetical protein
MRTLTGRHDEAGFFFLLADTASFYIRFKKQRWQNEEKKKYEQIYDSWTRLHSMCKGTAKTAKSSKENNNQYHNRKSAGEQIIIIIKTIVVLFYICL